jgi:hypothetical protein
MAKVTKNKSLNQSLHSAKAAKQDEFYTQYVDIQKEVEAYLEFDPDTFRSKIVYCNCDDPFESNFFKYFAANFNKLGLKKLITTSYDGSPIAGQGTLFPEYNEGNGKRQKPKALAVILDHVKDEDGDGAANVTDVELFLKRNKASRTALKADEKYPGGDFRSPECIALLKQSDVVATNPPFSLFREYVAQLMEHGKKFLIIGPKNAVTYKEIFPLIRDTKLWIGSGFANGNAYFSIPADAGREFADGVYDANTGLVKFRNVGWFTNLDHGRRHQKLECMTMERNLRFSKHKELKGKADYDRYDNYDAIEVPYTDAIPSDYDGVMGVPITFLDKYNPDQFEILGITKTWFGAACKTFPNQIQIGKGGARSIVSKLNDQPAMRVEKPPTGQTYYIVDGQHYIALYQRILIRRRTRAAKRDETAKGTKK